MSRCTLPLTGIRCVTRVYTTFGVFRPAGSHFDCLDIARGVDADEVLRMTDAEVSFHIRPLEAG